MGRIVDISSDGLHLSKFRGFLLASKSSEEVMRVPWDQVTAVVAHGHGISYSQNAITTMSCSHIPLVICGSDHRPVSYLISVDGYHAQAQVMRAQISAPAPLNKQIWKSIIERKIQTQASLLLYKTGSQSKLPRLAADVKSGDTSNREAEAARVYWPLLMGEGFKRDYKAAGINSALNYGYTILRSAIARYIMASGLHPTLGIFHKNAQNAFALADDLIEVYRPYIDVRALNCNGDLSAKTKHKMVATLEMQVSHDGEVTTLERSIQRMTASLSKSYVAKANHVSLPDIPSPNIWEEASEQNN